MVEIQWDNDEHTIIFCRFPKKWVLQDVYDMMSEIGSLVDTVDHEVYVIVDLLIAGMIPANVLSSSKSMSMKIHPRVKMFVDVTDSLFVEATSSIFKSIVSINADIKFVKTIQQAYELVANDMSESNVKM